MQALKCSFVPNVLKKFQEHLFTKAPPKWLSTTPQSNLTSETTDSQVSSNVLHGISIGEYVDRRQNVGKKLLEFAAREKRSQESGKWQKQLHIFIIPSAQKRFMVDKIPFFFRQSTDLRYLTGHLCPDSVLFLRVEVEPSSGQFDMHSTLFVQDSNSREEKWEGPRLKPGDAAAFYGVNASAPISTFQNFLRDYQNDDFRLWYDYLNPTHTDIHRTVMGFVQDSETLKSQSLESPRKIIHELRLLKSEAEIGLMDRSCGIGSSSIRDTIRSTLRLQNEAEAFATVDYHCRMRGAEFLAYPPVVAYGDNANTIHYTKNSAPFLDRRELILMDAGCEYSGYTSDITRVWPTSGKFSPAQKLVYEAVLDVQTRLIDILTQQEDLITVDWLYHEMQKFLGEHLVRLGLVREGLSEADLRVACSDYCPHHVSHYLGMDVHDTVQVPRNIPLRPGMVITVEPGLYISKSSKFLPPNRSEFAGIGVRIEDDVLITLGEDRKLSCRVLSSECPKSVHEIENLISS